MTRTLLVLLASCALYILYIGDDAARGSQIHRSLIMNARLSTAVSAVQKSIEDSVHSLQVFSEMLKFDLSLTKQKFFRRVEPLFGDSS